MRRYRGPEHRFESYSLPASEQACLANISNFFPEMVIVFRVSAIGRPVPPLPDRGTIKDSGITVKPGLDVSIRTVAGVTIAELTGKLDIASAPALREQFLSLLRPGSSRLVVDLSKVTFCDASGLAVLVGIGRRARLHGGFLRLAALSPQADQALHITGLHRHLPVSPLSTQPVHPSSSAAGQERSPKLPLPAGRSWTARRWPVLG